MIHVSWDTLQSEVKVAGSAMSALKDGAEHVAEKVQKLATPVVEAVITKKVSSRSNLVHSGMSIVIGFCVQHRQGGSEVSRCSPCMTLPYIELQGVNMSQVVFGQPQARSEKGLSILD